MSRLYGCPKCGSTEELGTIERLYGIAGATFTDETPRDIGFFGYTELDWDSQISVGLKCQACGWQWIASPERAITPEDMQTQLKLTEEQWA